MPLPLSLIRGQADMRKELAVELGIGCAMRAKSRCAAYLRLGLKVMHRAKSRCVAYLCSGLRFVFAPKVDVCLTCASG